MKIVMTIALFTAVTCFGMLGSAAEPDRPAPVLERCLVSLIDEAKLSVGEAGLLVEMQIKAGDRVTAGQVIARINDDQPQMDKLRAQAEHDQAIAKAKSDVDVRYSQKAQAVAQTASVKAEQSHKTVPGSVTDVERDRLRLEWEKSGLQIEQAQLERTLADLAARAKDVEVKTADINIKRRLVTAPLDGEVVDVQGNLGEWMQVGAPLAHIVRTDKLRVEGYVDAAKWDPEQVRGAAGRRRLRSRSPTTARRRSRAESRSSARSSRAAATTASLPRSPTASRQAPMNGCCVPARPPP